MQQQTNFTIKSSISNPFIKENIFPWIVVLISWAFLNCFPPFCQVMKQEDMTSYTYLYIETKQQSFLSSELTKKRTIREATKKRKKNSDVPDICSVNYMHGLS